MPRDSGPSYPYHVLLTPPEKLSGYLHALGALLSRVEPELDSRFEVSESVRNFGFGPCRVSQVVVYWDPVRSRLGERELLYYAQALALALGCELADLYAVAQNPDLLEPETLAASAARKPALERLPEALLSLKRTASERAVRKA